MLVAILPVKIVLKIVITRPKELHGFPDLFGYLPRFRLVVPLSTPPERSSRESHVNSHFAGWEPGDPYDVLLSQGGALGGRPYFDAIVAHVYGGVHRFHGGVSLE